MYTSDYLRDMLNIRNKSAAEHFTLVSNIKKYIIKVVDSPPGCNDIYESTKRFEAFAGRLRYADVT